MYASMISVFWNVTLCLLVYNTLTLSNRHKNLKSKMYVAFYVHIFRISFSPRNFLCALLSFLFVSFSSSFFVLFFVSILFNFFQFSSSLVITTVLFFFRLSTHTFFMYANRRVSRLIQWFSEVRKFNSVHVK